MCALLFHMTQLDGATFSSSNAMHKSMSMNHRLAFFHLPIKIKANTDLKDLVIYINLLYSSKHILGKIQKVLMASTLEISKYDKICLLTLLVN